MHAHLAYTLASVAILFTLASAIAYGQGAGSLDIAIPASFPMADTAAYGSSGAVGVHGSIDIFAYGSGLYVSIPSNASDGDNLSFFQDTSTWALFRNNTLVLPVRSGQDVVANLILATGDLASSSGRFYGQVTGIELDTKALAEGDTSTIAALYLEKLPDMAEYRVAISDNDQAKNAITGEASKNGQQGIVKLMVEVAGASPDVQNSIGYVIVRMKYDGPEPDGNVTAYRYYNGVVSKVPCKMIKSAEGIVYETISSGPGVFAFLGPFRETPPIRASMQSVLIFAGALAVSLMLLITVIVRGLKWSTKKE